MSTPGETSAGGLDVFLRKYDSGGTELWTHQFSVALSDRPWEVADRTGRVSVAGETSGQGGSERNAFVARVDIIELLFLHAEGATLFLDSNSPANMTAIHRDSAALKFDGGNPWKTIATWARSPAGETRTLRSLGNTRVWLGLRNSDDQGTLLDLRAELLKNGVPIASGETRCIRGVTRNPASALEVFVPFGAIGDAALGPADTLSVRISARIGTDGNGAFCGGHVNAEGLRLYFDAASRPSRFEVTFE